MNNLEIALTFIICTIFFIAFIIGIYIIVCSGLYIFNNYIIPDIEDLFWEWRHSKW